jgi:membrane-associated phospholipid phosphatase
VVAVGATLVVVTIPVAVGGPPGSVEVSVFRWFNDPPRVVDAWLGLIEPLLRPVGLLLVVVGLVVLVIATRRDICRPLLVSAASAAGLAYVLDHLLKLLVGRGRPPEYLDGVLLHGYPVDPRGSGFPSSHMAVAIAILTGVWPWLDPPWRVAGVAFVSAIGLDRIYVGAHFPLDVVAGIGVGLLAGESARFLTRRLPGWGMAFVREE